MRPGKRDIKSRLWAHHVAFIIGFTGLVVLLLAGSNFAHDRNLTLDPHTPAFIKVAESKYEYSRFLGKSKLESFKSIFGDSVVSADSPSPHEFAQSVPVLLYHNIGNAKNPYTETLATFKNQMFTLKKLGYTTLTMSQYEQFLKGTYKPGPKSVLITFDDGTRTGYDNADPIFQALGFHATDFIITKYSIEQSGSHYYLSPSDLKRMEASNRWDVETHTNAGHTLYPIDSNGTKGDFYSNKLWLSDKNRLETDQEFQTRVTDDIQTANSQLRSVIKTQPTAFAFPFGDYGQDSVNYPGAQQVLLSAIQKNFKVSMMQYYSGRGNSQEYFGDNSLVARRIEVTPSWDGAHLVSALTLGQSKDINFSDNFSSNKGWRQSSGNVSVKDGALDVTSDGTNKSSTAAATLDGGFYWGNYSFTANTHLVKGTSLTLTARNLNPNNYVGCEFSTDHIAVIQVKDGHTTVINSGAYSLSPTDTASYGMTVENNMLGCTLNGNLMAIGTTDNAPVAGGIGISVWDTIKANAEATVTDVQVTPTQSTLDTSLLNVDLSAYDNWSNLTAHPAPDPGTCLKSQIDDQVSTIYNSCNDWSAGTVKNVTLDDGKLQLEEDTSATPGQSAQATGDTVQTQGISMQDSTANDYISGGRTGE